MVPPLAHMAHGFSLQFLSFRWFDYGESGYCELCMLFLVLNETAACSLLIPRLTVTDYLDNVHPSAAAYSC